MTVDSPLPAAVIVPQRPSAPLSLLILRVIALAIILAAITLAVLPIATA